MKYSIWSAISALALLLSIGSVAIRQANAQDSTNNTQWLRTEQDFQFNTTVLNGCVAGGGESVTLADTGHISVRTRFHQGFLDIKEADTFSGSGTGSVTGVAYDYAENDAISTTVGPNPDGTPFSFTNHEVAHLSAEGQVSNQTVQFDIRLVIDSTGNITTNIDNFNIHCAGQ